MSAIVILNIEKTLKLHPLAVSFTSFVWRQCVQKEVFLLELYIGVILKHTTSHNESQRDTTSHNKTQQDTTSHNGTQRDTTSHNETQPVTTNIN